MTSTTVGTSTRKAPPGYATMADVLERLGGLPARRVWLTPRPGEATEQDAIYLQEHHGRLCELVDGTLVEKDMGFYESRLALVLGYFIESYLELHALGIVVGADGMLRLFPNQIRIPDLSFISWKRMPAEVFPIEKVPTLAPDLAVEILSEGNTDEEMNRKLKDYFQAGSKLVWYVDPRTRTVRVYTSPRKSVLLTEADTLDGGKVLPGFALPIKQWFQRASRKPRK